MPIADYGPPLDRLLAYGKPEPVRDADWPDYVQELGLGPEHIPDLIHMATDAELRWKEGDDEEAVTYWAPIHAWRALGQLHAEAAIAPLLPLLADEDDEWAWEEVPLVYGLIGPAALPTLQAYLTDAEHDYFARWHAAIGLTAIARRYPAAHADVVAAFTRQLEAFADNEPEINSILISELTDLKATEALPLIEQVFAADLTDNSILDWEFVQVAFGLMTQEEAQRLRDARRQAIRAAIPPSPRDEWAPSGSARNTPQHAKAKAKRKMVKESRRKNKKRK